MVSPQWTLSVDAGRCIGSGTCAGTAPRHFTLVGGTSVPVAERVEPDDDVMAAADLCPVTAITVRDGDGHLISPEP
jgi:ferredoxin